MNNRDKDWKIERKLTFKPRSRCCRVVGFRTATFKCVNLTSLCGGFLYYRLVPWLNLRSRRLDITAKERTGRTRETSDPFSPRVFSSRAPFFVMPITSKCLLPCPCGVSLNGTKIADQAMQKHRLFQNIIKKMHTTTQNWQNQNLVFKKETNNTIIKIELNAKLTCVHVTWSKPILLGESREQYVKGDATSHAHARSRGST